MEKITQKKLEGLAVAFSKSLVLRKNMDKIKSKFDPACVFIPWYLKPFKKRIIGIASTAHLRGYLANIGSNDTVKFKRPVPFVSTGSDCPEQ